MSTRAALATGIAVSLAVTAAWSHVASVAIGPAVPLHLDPNLAADCVQLAAAPTGNGTELFAVIVAIYATCLLVCGRRQRRGGG
jgi:hypothetical protein